MYVDWRWVVAVLVLGGAARLTEWLLSRLDQRAADRAKIAAKSAAEQVRITHRLEGIVDQQRRELDEHQVSCNRNRETLATLQTEVRSLRSEVATLRSENADLRGQVNLLTGQLAASDGEIARLRAEARR